MYKDKAKQKEANKIASQRRRDKAKGMTDVITGDVYVIPEPDQNVIPKKQGITCVECDREYEGIGCSHICRAKQKRVSCFEQLPADVRRTIESMASSPADKQARTERAIRYQRMYPSPHSTGLNYIGGIDLSADYKTADQLAPGKYNRASKPGDPDYPTDKGQCRTCGAETQIKSITKCHKCVEAA